MKVVIKKGGQTINELFFGEQPLYIGRHSDCEVCLPDKTVSRKHAVIYPRESGQWFVEDLDSANKTYVSGRQIKQADVKSGDTLLIGSFTIEIDLTAPPQNAIEAEETLQVEASLTTPRSETVVRRPDEVHAPAMRLAAKRLADFSEAAEAICKTETLDNLLAALLNITMKQFEAFHTWCALRHQSAGPMTCHAGRKRDSTSVSFDQLQLKDKITQAIERNQSIVFPSVSAEMEQAEKIRSAMIAPIVRRGGCLGVLYVDNAMMHEHYTLGDLDYLILLAMHTAAVLKYYL
jgi:pSer/pThr/pTyr-binding forkhead associated (FHA) protein